MTLHFKYILLQFCTRFFGIILSRESLPKGRYWYTVDLLVLVQIGCFYTEIIFFLITKLVILKRRSTVRSPSFSVRVPCSIDYVRRITSQISLVS